MTNEENKSWVEKFEDFYWEKNEFAKRPLGIDEYKKFFSSELTAFAKEMVEAVPKEKTKEAELEKEKEIVKRDNWFFNSALSQTRQAQMKIVKKFNINL